MSRSLQQGLGAISPFGTTDNDSSFPSGGHQLFDSLKVGEAKKLHVLFACRIHYTAARPYSASIHPTSKDFAMQCMDAISYQYLLSLLVNL
jgi:hypothetical protein